MSNAPIVTWPDDFWRCTAVDGDCWTWQRRRQYRRGYGQVRFFGRTTSAHRVAYQITFGPFPQNLYVLHRCDNPPCVRPEHLFLGTQFDNMRDMSEKGRDPRDKHPQRPKMTWTPQAVADAIVIARREKQSRVDVAERFGVTVKTVTRITKGRHWTSRDEVAS